MGVPGFKSEGLSLSIAAIKFFKCVAPEESAIFLLKITVIGSLHSCRTLTAKLFNVSTVSGLPLICSKVLNDAPHGLSLTSLILRTLAQQRLQVIQQLNGQLL